MDRAQRRKRSVVLYVEDSTAERDALFQVLERSCGRVVCAADGEEALTLFDRERPDLVLSDIRMPKTDGMTLARLIKAKNPFVPIVFVSAHNESEYLLQALRIGVRDFLFKPVEVPELLNMLDRILEEAQAQRQCEALRLVGKSSQELAHVMRTVELIRPMADAAPVLMWLSDDQGSCFFFNEGWIQFTGTPMEELVGEGWLEDVHPEDRARCLGLYRDAFEQREPFEMEYRLRRHDGEYRLIYDRGAPRFDGGQFEGYVGSCIDITDLREATAQRDDLKTQVSIEQQKRQEQEALLIQQSKMAAMGEMIGAIAHQWRQPLNALSILVQDIPDALAHGELNDAYAKEVAGKAMLQIQHMSKTIDDFRSFFTPDKTKSTFSLQKAVSSVLDLVGAQLKGHGITVRIELPQEPVMITGPINQLKQAILNLISNAQDAIDQKGIKRGEIVVSLSTQGGVILSVCDNGGGIDPAVLDRIFEPYFTTKGEGRGTGIGLYMTENIIKKQFGGQIRALNAERGACFEMRL